MTSEASGNLSQMLGPMMAANLYWWSECVFKPAKIARKLGLYRPPSIGQLPAFTSLEGGGPGLSHTLKEPLFLETRPEHYGEVEDFDKMAPLYESAVLPFSQPIYEDMCALLLPYLSPNCRILDPSCGPGTESTRLAELVPDGEVIAADLSRGMVEYACQRANKAGLNNMGFVQADVAAPPEIFHGYFDLIFCELSFHHYPDPVGAVNSFKKVLRKGGLLIIADPGPAWFNRLAKTFSDLADPGFVKHRTGEEFQQLCKGAGFRSCYWVESLPGIGLSLAMS